MQVPRPDAGEYVTTTLTVVLTLAVLQYAGIFFDGSGGIDPGYLLGVGLTLPVFIFLFSLAAANVSWIPSWDEKNHTGGTDGR
ncbi:hypothetical protein HALLA_19590 [Halostagnicola larsenii XH-48]|uniref:Uncharacterized protein n=1 Tax=Halostagnicola larsenii XH-48 TaxID=797299 RepID=W0JRF5_9EURY|nr:hypothetical protein [Halostagnicola larsenii]AHG01199.1 hypothetical protein HALLA_19590 [Halostagnicola larsenii XH-48]